MASLLRPPGPVTGLAARSARPGHVELFARMANGMVWRAVIETRSWDHPIQWIAGDYPEPVDLPAGGAEPHRFEIGGNGNLLHYAPDQPDYRDLGGAISGGLDQVAAVAADGSGADVFAIWFGTALLHRSFDGQWSPWRLIDLFDEPSNSYTVLRSRDLVALTVRSTALHEVVAADGGVAWMPDGAEGRLIVDFPPQHIAETVLAPGGTTSKARLAGPSSLQFVVRNQRVVLSVDGVLNSMGGALPLAVKPRVQGQASTLELPWRLLLGLQDGAKCVHRTRPMAGGDNEIWHTRVLLGDGTYAAVFPFKSLLQSSEQPFAAGTPLETRVNDIAAAGSGHSEQGLLVDRLILSACGAWFSGSVSWPELDWTHRSAMARDYYVRISMPGFLFPFGHRAAVIELTERRFDTDPPSLAGLKKTRILVVAQPHVTYGVGAPHQRAFPFQKIEIEPRFVTGLDRPDPGSAFWPKRNGTPIMFSVRGLAGKETVEMQLPLLFSNGTRPELLDGIFAQGPRSFEAAPVRPTALVGRSIPLAFKSAEEALEQSAQQVQSIAFGGAVTGSGPGFHPSVVGLEVALPAVNQLLGPIPPIPATLSNQLLQWRPGTTPPDELLNLHPSSPIRLNFGSAKTGVVAAPNFGITKISRSLGPTAPPPPNPADFFGRDAKLLGAIPISDLIAQISTPPMIKWTGGANPTAVMNWAENLRRSSGPFIPGTGCRVDLQVTSSVVQGRPLVTTQGTIADFELKIPSPASALVTLKFTQLNFQTTTGGLPVVKPEIASATLEGDLKFVQRLSEYLPKLGKSGPTFDVTPTQIRVGYALAIPTPLSLGVFVLQNLFLRTSITLSFVNQPVLIDFSFGTRANPFLVTVTGFGGGGYLELGIGAGGQDNGLQRFVGGIEFGASVAMNFGIASGEVHVFGGVVFAKQGGSIEITGYLRIGGMVRVLALISVSIELTVSLTYDPVKNELRGAAKLIIAVDLTFWSTSVEIGCERSFPGSFLSLDAGPLTPEMAPGSSIVDAFGPVGPSFPWQSYCRAFTGA